MHAIHLKEEIQVLKNNKIGFTAQSLASFSRSCIAETNLINKFLVFIINFSFDAENSKKSFPMLSFSTHQFTHFLLLVAKSGNSSCIPEKYYSSIFC